MRGFVISIQFGMAEQAVLVAVLDDPVGLLTVPAAGPGLLLFIEYAAAEVDGDATHPLAGSADRSASRKLAASSPLVRLGCCRRFGPDRNG